jgi:hypothetical protein
MAHPSHKAAPARGRTSVSRKIFLLVAVFSVPIGALAYLLAANYTPQIETAEMELAGNALQKPLMKCLYGVVRSQNIVEACRTNQCAAELASQRAAVDASLAGAIGRNSQYVTELKTDAETLAKAGHPNLSLTALQAEWNSLSVSAANSITGAGQGELTERYRLFAGEIAQLVGYVGNTSGLILDPDLDSYYLVDVTLLTMPDTVSHIAASASVGDKVISGGSAVDLAALANERTSLQRAFDRIAASNQITFDADAANHGVSPTLASKMGAALQSYQSAAAAYLATLRNIGEKPSGVSAAALSAQNASLQSASLDYWNAAAGELDALLEMRISDFRTHRMQALGLSALALFIAAFIAFLIGRSITKPLDELVHNLGPGATLLGVSVERIAEASRNQTPDPVEVSIICEELNAHADNMRNAVLELARHVQGGAASPEEISAGSRRLN